MHTTLQPATMLGNREATGRKRLAVFLDGTWNEPGDHTNVWRLYLMLADVGAGGLPQQAYYDPGVGTHWYDRLTGGMFGAGLSENVCNAYRWLMEHYNPDDEIYVFGFSRGAFTARSLVGLIARCGLLRPEAPISFMQLYDRYRAGNERPAIQDMKYFGKKPANLEDEVVKYQTHYRKGMVKMVGVWDTVGSVGLPFGNWKGISASTLRFHHTRLSTLVEHSYHALALDEYRRPYWAVLWQNFIPAKRTDVPANDVRHVEQRWFAGAHANLGGGYRSDLFPQRPLAWLQKKASSCGLGFRSSIAPTDEDLETRPTDSYSEFLGGAWKYFTAGDRYVRWVKSDPVWKETSKTKNGAGGWVHSVNERIDPSVWKRWNMHSCYRPLGLLEWAKRTGTDLKAVAAAPESYPGLCDDVKVPGIELPAANKLIKP